MGKTKGPLRPMRPFFEAALVLFSAGATPSTVAKKFEGVISRGTIQRWHNAWSDLKGIDRTTTMERKSRTPRKPVNPDSELLKKRREARVKEAREDDTGLISRYSYKATPVIAKQVKTDEEYLELIGAGPSAEEGVTGWEEDYEEKGPSDEWPFDELGFEEDPPTEDDEDFC